MDALANAVRRHRVLMFFALAYVLTWGAIPWDSFFAPGALIAAILVVAVTEGLPGLRDLGGRLVRWRVGAKWWAVALVVPLLVDLAAAVSNVALGAAAPLTAQLLPWYGIPLAIGLAVVNPTNGPLAEEPSFRGYALPSLQSRHTPLVATAILAVAVTGWHAPLFVMSSFDLHPVHAVTTIAVTFWYTWLFDHAGGSALITLVAHATEGSVDSQSLFAASADAARMDWLYAAAWVSVAVVLLVADRRFWTGRAPGAAVHPDPQSRSHRAGEGGVPMTGRAATGR
ncbi:type II CAAX prenyl endopeptidase Rce1 family protein [Nocardioides sp.]|uniref:CPBP family glutamic-type intramembrane protease n=1 Tax=Nocardioides sp. TaxID=35761 RepID=UPI002ED16635